jgi:hypothetical protein
VGQVDKPCGDIITLEAITKSHRRFSKVESGLNKGQKLHIWFSKVESGLNKGQRVTYGFPKWKVA